MTYGDERVNAKIMMSSTNHVSNYVLFNGRHTQWGEEKHVNGVYSTLLAELRGAKIGGWKKLTPQQIQANEHPTLQTQTTHLGFSPTAKTQLWTTFWLLPGEDGWTMHIDVIFNSAYNAGKYRYTYTYDSSMPPPPPTDPQSQQTDNSLETIDNQTAEELAAATQSQLSDDQQAASNDQPPADLSAEQAAEKLKQEKIEFYQDQIKLLDDDIRRYQKMLSSIEENSDKDQVVALNYLLIAKQADRQRELDQIATLITGNFTRTRTVFDEVVSMQMQANSRKTAIKIHEDLHRSQTIERLINLMPEDQRSDLRRWARKSLGSNSTDLEAQRKVAAVISKRVQEYYTAEAQEHLAEADAYQETIDTLEYYQVPATYMMYATPFVTGGPALALAYGITSGGIDGYFTGGILGPDNKGAAGAAVGSVLTSARYLSAKFDYALTFYEGYTMPDESGEQGGVYGALKHVAITFVKRQAVQKFTQFGLRCQARIQAQQQQAKLDAWRDSERKAEFEWQRRIGKERVKSHQAAYQNYKQLKASGASPMALKIAQQKLMDKTIAVMHSPHAKGYLKFNATKAEQYAYNSTSKLHINKVINEFKVELQKQGFDTTQLKFQTMRNAGNTTPGMDTDIGMVSTFANGRQICRTDPATGKQSNMDLYRGGQAAQSIFNTVYRRNSGGRESAESWTQITTADSLESYRDKTWLNTSARCRKGLNPKYGIDPKHASDAARITEQKLYEIEQGHHPQSTKFWEKCRGTAKDIDSKVITLLKQKIINTGSQQKKTELRTKLKFYQDMSEALKLANHDPVAAEQAVKQLTGFDPVEAMKMTTIGIEMLGK